MVTSPDTEPDSVLHEEQWVCPLSNEEKPTLLSLGRSREHGSLHGRSITAAHISLPILPLYKAKPRTTHEAQWQGTLIWLDR